MGATILVVDDDQDVRLVLEKSLGRLGYQVVTAVNGTNALAKLGEVRPALVVLDVRMPGMGGYELLEKLRELPDHAATPVILLTGEDKPQDVLRGYRHGVDCYLTKPVDTMELAGYVERLVGAGGGA